MYSHARFHVSTIVMSESSSHTQWSIENSDDWQKKQIQKYILAYTYVKFVQVNNL